MITLTRFIKSVQHAMRGVRVVFASEQSFRLQLWIGLAVFALAALFRVGAFQWIILLFTVGSVLTLELVNSIFERMVDSFKPRIHPIVKDIKDIMAGAVLIASLVAACVGIVIFFPYVHDLVSSLPKGYT